ncbi:hypothetical protein X943_000498 [Babesia divergens]|uniref:Uncharacterized protein n=1 Tax=Babesia divergens TaxID=32595 RepID=A0AAD9GJ48_BABDI|nr:hypothetical protein X943_000498 [Babesia divergens]
MDVIESDAEENLGAPEVDLFAGESDYEDDIYRASEVTGGGIPIDMTAPIHKPAKKGHLLSLDNFWHNTSNHLLEAPRTRKNVLWDFMVFHNLREEREGRYVATVQQLEAEIVLAIKKTKVAILSDVSENAHVGLFVNDVAATFDLQVMKLISRFRVHAMDGSPLCSKSGGDFEEVERKVAIETYLHSNKDFLKLKSKLSAFRMTKNRLVMSSLTRLLSSVDGMRSKVLSELFAPDSRGFKQTNLTRFLRHMDKVTDRTDFSGEYRFDLLKTFVQHKDYLETFIQHNSTFVSDGSDTNKFEDFINPFTPDHDEADIAYDKTAPSAHQQQGTPGDTPVEEPMHHDHMMDFMNATPPDDMLLSPSTYEPTPDNYDNTPYRRPMDMPSANQVTEEAAKTQVDEKLIPDEEDAQLKLLAEARKKAAEILRLKRLNRVNGATNAG